MAKNQFSYTDEQLTEHRPKKTLTYGHEGWDVLATQKALKSLGYYEGKLDSDFGRETGRALSSFQLEHGLTPDARLGPKTKAELFPKIPENLKDIPGGKMPSLKNVRTTPMRREGGPPKALAKEREGITHTVQSGESLGKIAQQFDTNWRDIYNANKDIIGSDPNLIRSGQTLTIPGVSKRPDFTVNDKDITGNIDSKEAAEAATTSTSRLVNEAKRVEQEGTPEEMKNAIAEISDKIDELQSGEKKTGTSKDLQKQAQKAIESGDTEAMKNLIPQVQKQMKQAQTKSATEEDEEEVVEEEDKLGQSDKGGGDTYVDPQDVKKTLQDYKDKKYNDVKDLFGDFTVQQTQVVNDIRKDTQKMIQDWYAKSDKLKAQRKESKKKIKGLAEEAAEEYEELSEVSYETEKMKKKAQALSDVNKRIDTFERDYQLAEEAERSRMAPIGIINGRINEIRRNKAIEGNYLESRKASIMQEYELASNLADKTYAMKRQSIKDKINAINTQLETQKAFLDRDDQLYAEQLQFAMNRYADQVDRTQALDDQKANLLLKYPTVDYSNPDSLTDMINDIRESGVAEKLPEPMGDYVDTEGNVTLIFRDPYTGKFDEVVWEGLAPPETTGTEGAGTGMGEGIFVDAEGNTYDLTTRSGLEAFKEAGGKWGQAKAALEGAQRISTINDRLAGVGFKEPGGTAKGGDVTDAVVEILRENPDINDNALYLEVRDRTGASASDIDYAISEGKRIAQKQGIIVSETKRMKHSVASHIQELKDEGWTRDEAKQEEESLLKDKLELAKDAKIREPYKDILENALIAVYGESRLQKWLGGKTQEERRKEYGLE